MPILPTAQELLYFNGIDATTGDYTIPPVSSMELSTLIQAGGAPDNLSELKQRHQDSTQQFLGTKEGVNPKYLSESGWGVIFASDADPAVEEALRELMELRQEQAGAHFRIFAGEQGYRPNESKTRFLARHGVGRDQPIPRECLITCCWSEARKRSLFNFNIS